MPFLIATKRKAGTQALVTGNATNQQRYANLKSTFAANNLYRLFAEPTESARDVSWYTDWDPDPAQPLLTLGELTATDPARADEVRGRVASLMDQFFRSIRQYETDPRHHDRLRQVLTDSFELPDAETNVWILIDRTGQERYVLTQWGHIKDEFNPDRGIINRWNRLARLDIEVMLRYRHNRQPAPNETLYVTDTSQPGRQQTVVSGASGSVLLEKVLAGSPVEYGQTDSNGATYNTGTLMPDPDRDSYEILLDKWLVVSLLVQQQGQPKPNERVVVDWNGQRLELLSDAVGRITLPPLAAGTSIRAFQEQDGTIRNEQTYRADPGQPDLLFTLPEAAVIPPDPVALPDTTVILHDQTDKPVAGGLVRLDWAGSQVPRTLDERGATVLTGIAPGQVVTLAYLKDPAGNQASWQGQFTRIAGQDEYVLRMKRRWPWWWWFLGTLLGMLLLFLLLCFLKLLPICPYCCVSAQPMIFRNDTITKRDTVFRRDTVMIGDTTVRAVMQPCGEATKAGSNQQYVGIHPMGKTAGEFELIYYTGGAHPDAITVFEGEGTGGKVLFTTKTLPNADSSGRVITEVRFPFIGTPQVPAGQDYEERPSGIQPSPDEVVIFYKQKIQFNNPAGKVTVLVEPEPNPETLWIYQVNCPQP